VVSALASGQALLPLVAAELAMLQCGNALLGGLAPGRAG
jgi:hypothetical protein